MGGDFLFITSPTDFLSQKNNSVVYLVASHNHLGAHHGNTSGWCSSRAADWCNARANDLSRRAELLDATVPDGTSAESEWLGGTIRHHRLTIGHWLLD